MGLCWQPLSSIHKFLFVFNLRTTHTNTTALFANQTNACISCLPNYIHMSQKCKLQSLALAHSPLRTHTYNFPQPGPSRQRPCIDPMPQLIKAYSTGILQHSSSVTLPSVSKAYMSPSLSCRISRAPLYPCSLLNSSCPLSSFPHPVFLFLVSFTPSPFPLPFSQSLSLLFHQ